MLRLARLRVEQACLCGEKTGLSRGVVLRRRAALVAAVALAVASLAYLHFLSQCAAENAALAEPCTALAAVRARPTLLPSFPCTPGRLRTPSAGSGHVCTVRVCVRERERESWGVRGRRCGAAGTAPPSNCRGCHLGGGWDPSTPGGPNEALALHVVLCEQSLRC
jgi:hypothetical protein